MVVLDSAEVSSVSTCSTLKSLKVSMLKSIQGKSIQFMLFNGVFHYSRSDRSSN